MNREGVDGRLWTNDRQRDPITNVKIGFSARLLHLTDEIAGDTLSLELRRNVRVEHNKPDGRLERCDGALNRRHEPEVELARQELDAADHSAIS